MKLNFTRFSLLLTAVAIVYTSCKKAETVPGDQTTDYAAIGGKIALSLVQSISGKNGGADINDGIHPPTTQSSVKNGPVVNDVAPLYGTEVDNTYSNAVTVNDTAKTFNGNFKFVYLCSNGNLNAYTLHDSVTNTEVGAKFNNKFIVSQNYSVIALDNNYNLVSMEGTILSSIFAKVLAASGATTAYHQINTLYVLKGLKVDLSSGVADVTTGVATFTTTTNDLDANTAVDGTKGGYIGSITFLGHHTATLSINNGTTVKNYTVNLTTGVVTPV